LSGRQSERLLPITRPALPPLEEYVALLEEIWESRMLSNFATFAQRLEVLARDYLGATNVLAVSSGDVGLVATLTALDLPAGSPCYVSDFTFNSTINAAVWARLEPVLIDIDRATFGMDADRLRAAMHERREPGVVLPTHVFGNPCDTDRLTEVAREFDAYLVFDAAHAYGSRRRGRAVGTFGDAEVFSLSGTKLTTSAEGGLVATPHEWLAERLRFVRAYGFQDDYRSHRIGLNGKISELHCALGTLTLADVEAQVQRRHELFAAYRDRLGTRVGWQQVSDADRSTYKDIAVLLGCSRGVVEQALADQGVQTKRYFVPLHEMGPYAQFADGPMPRASELHEECLCVPAFTDLTDGDVHRVSDTILRAMDDG
jgi:dTDP-4-amino-4,6-dideoxygalactose transaminase